MAQAIEQLSGLRRILISQPKQPGQVGDPDFRALAGVEAVDVGLCLDGSRLGLLAVEEVAGHTDGDDSDYGNNNAHALGGGYRRIRLDPGGIENAGVDAVAHLQESLWTKP